MADSMRATRLAQKDGFLRAEHMINWNGYEVYTPIPNDEPLIVRMTEDGCIFGDIPMIGQLLILQNDEECRWATIKEYDTIMFSFSEEEIEDFMNGQS